MPTSEINAYTTPESTSQPTWHEDLINLVRQMMLGDIMRFANSTERTTVFDDLNITPPTGATCYLVSSDRHEKFNGTAWVPLPGTRIATEVVTSDSSSFTTTETQVASVTGDLVDGATYKVRFVGGWTQDAAGSNTLEVKIREDSSAGAQLNSRVKDLGSTSFGWHTDIEAEYTATSSGDKTFVVTGDRTSGSQNLRLEAGSDHPAYLYIDYIRG